MEVPYIRHQGVFYSQVNGHRFQRNYFSIFNNKKVMNTYDDKEIVSHDGMNSFHLGMN